MDLVKGLGQEIKRQALQDIAASPELRKSRASVARQRAFAEITSALEARRLLADGEQPGDSVTPFQAAILAEIDNAEAQVDALARVISEPASDHSAVMATLGTLMGTWIGRTLALEVRLTALEEI